MVPGTEAQATAAKLDTIKANIGFDKLQKMRDASPTGGALGQVSERELGFLQSLSSVASINRSRPSRNWPTTSENTAVRATTRSYTAAGITNLVDARLWRGFDWWFIRHRRCHSAPRTRSNMHTNK